MLCGPHSPGSQDDLHPLEALLQASSQRIGATQMTSHVGADPHSNLRGRRQMKVRKEIRHAVNVVQRDFGLLRERLQLLARQVTVLILNGSKIVEDQNAIPFACRLPESCRGFIIG